VLVRDAKFNVFFYLKCETCIRAIFFQREQKDKNLQFLFFCSLEGFSLRFYDMFTLH